MATLIKKKKKEQETRSIERDQVEYFNAFGVFHFHKENTKDPKANSVNVLFFIFYFFFFR